MSRIADLPLDPGTADSALRELGLTEAEFWALDADRLGEVIDAHGARVQAWHAREKVRIERLEAARRLVQGVPRDMGVWHAAQEGFIAPADAQAALHAHHLVEQESAADPMPDARAVAALLKAVLGGVAGAEGAGG